MLFPEPLGPVIIVCLFLYISIFVFWNKNLSDPRYLKSTVGEDIKFDEYPYDSLWNVEISKKSFLQDHIHFLLAQRQIDEGNIKNELLKLKNSNKKYKSSFFSAYRTILFI